MSWGSNSMTNKKITGYLLLAAGLVLFILTIAFVAWFMTVDGSNGVADKTSQQLCEENGGSWSADYEECLGVTEEACESIGGEFEFCASPCRHESGTPACIEMCVQVCQL